LLQSHSPPFLYFSRLLLATLTFALLCLSTSAHAYDDTPDDDGNDEDYSVVTYGSAIKLQHKSSGVRLHSHQINWGSGSGQQSVTGFKGADDANSLWQLKEAFTKADTATNVALPGTPIKCGDIIRLQHVSTKRWLHSHMHTSPLSHRQEVSGYGQDGGVGSDSGDNWKVECYGKPKDGLWGRETAVSLVHVDTGKRLYTRRSDEFNNNNCRGCPIVGQTEISAHATGLQDANALWKVEDGIYFPVRES